MDLAEAAGIHRETLEVERRVLGAEHTSTLISVYNYADDFEEQGELPEAGQMHRETFAAKRRGAPEHADVGQQALYASSRNRESCGRPGGSTARRSRESCACSARSTRAR